MGFQSGRATSSPPRHPVPSPIMNPDTSTTTPTAARMSGGEIEGPLRDAFVRLSRLIRVEPDVHLLIALDRLPDDDDLADRPWIYLIETPFATFPRFVIGRTDDDNENPDILFQSSTEWSAMEEWQNLIGRPA